MKGEPHIVRKVLKSGIVWYIYAWRGGPQVRRAEGPSKPRVTANDWAQISSLRNEAEARPVKTVGRALTAFRASNYWNGLAPTTRKTWGTALDQIEAKWGQFPLKALDDPRMKPKIVKWRDSMSSTPRAADIALTVLSKFFDWAILDGSMLHNPALRIPTIYRAESRADVIWLDHDLRALKAEAAQPLKDAIDLAVLTGLRRADLVSLRWDEIGDFAINRTASKRSRGKRFSVSRPLTPELKELLDSLRKRPRKDGVETVLVNSYGQAWSGDGLASSFHDARKKANNGEGIWHEERDPISGETRRTQKRLHDLRGTYATRIMTHPDASLTNNEVASLMGWSVQQVDQIRKRYVDGEAIVVELGRRLSGAV